MRQGYGFALPLRISSGPEGTRTRLLGRPARLVGGPEGTALFYGERRLIRRGAIPLPLRWVLFGRGAVHGLDGEAHRARKELFLRVLDEEAADDIARRAGQLLERDLAALRGGERTVVFDLAVQAYGGAVCGWAGVPERDQDPDRLRDLAAIVDGFGGLGPRYWRAAAARRRANRWSRRLVREARSGSLPLDSDAPLRRVAEHREGGRLLPVGVAAVELLNLLRPTVAVAWFACFAATALGHDPRLAQRLRAEGTEPAAFTREVRRSSPFVPLLAARATETFAWHGSAIERGERVVLDVYGTLHDPRCFPDPERFAPERFRDRPPDASTFIPQGGGPREGHRCPGEAVAGALIAETARVLLRVPHRLPPQDLSVRLDRVPARPRSGVVLERLPG